MYNSQKNSNLCYSELVGRAFMQKRNKCSQQFPLPLAIRIEISVLIRASSSHSPHHLLVFLQDSIRKNVGSLAFERFMIYPIQH